MDTSVTIREAAELTGLSERTLRRRIAAGTLPDTRVNARRYAIPVSALPKHKPSPTHELAARVEALERAVQRLTYAVEALTGARTPPPQTQPSDFHYGASDAPYGVPAGSRLMRAVAEEHGVSPATATRQVKAGMLQAFTRLRPNRPEHTEHWLTPEQVAPAVRVWRESGNAFHPCPNCPHE